jgi:hypothetical protein
LVIISDFIFIECLFPIQHFQSGQIIPRENCTNGK